MILRDYQQDAVSKTMECFQGKQAVLIVLATGLGKTVVASHIAERFKEKGRILLLAHREELIFQGQRTLERVTGEKSEIEMADSWATKGSFFGGAQIVCSTYQTQIAGRDLRRMHRFSPYDFSLVIADEAHHAVSPSQRTVLDYYRQNKDIRILGLTATPDRMDEAALGKVFDDVACVYDIANGVSDGWLVPIMQQMIHVDGLDFSSVRTTAGELNGKDLAAVLEFEQNLHGMVTPILDVCGDKKTLIFTASVAQAERMAEILNRHKPESAEFVSGETPKEYRRSLFERYAAGTFQYLCNVGVLTEGFDEPGVEYIVMARPTKSRSLFAQCLGRGTRALPGIVDGLSTPDERKSAIAASLKPMMVCLDFVGNAGRHKLVHPADVLGGQYEDEVIELATRNAERDGKPADIASELVKAEREIDRRRRARTEADARAKIKLQSRYRTSTIDPFDVLDIIPGRIPGWHQGRLATDGQKRCLEKFGVNISEDLGFTRASQLIDALIKRSKGQQASYKQTKLLKSRGLYQEGMTFADARKAIDDLAQREGWGKRKTG